MTVAEAAAGPAATVNHVQPDNAFPPARPAKLFIKELAVRLNAIPVLPAALMINAAEHAPPAIAVLEIAAAAPAAVQAKSAIRETAVRPTAPTLVRQQTDAVDPARPAVPAALATPPFPI